MEDNFNEIKDELKQDVAELGVDAKIEPYGTENVSDEQILEIPKESAPSGSGEATMTQEQANAVMNIAKNPKDFIGAKVSAEINDLIERNDSVKQKIADIAEDTTTTGLETFAASNKKQRKSNYFDLNEKDIVPLGGDKSSSKGQQVIIVTMRRLFWMLIMATLGFFYIAGLTVLVELFQGLGFRKIEKEEIVNAKSGEAQTRQYITRTKLGSAGAIIGFIFGIVFDGAVLAGNIFFPLIYLNISVCVFAVMLIINTFFGINFSKIGKLFKNKNANDENAGVKTTVVVEDEN